MSGLVSEGGNIAIFVVFLVVDVFVLSLRLWSRWIKKQALKLDDYLIIFCTACGIAYSAVEFYAIIDAGSGQPTDKLGPNALQKEATEIKFTNVSGPLWAFGSAAFKLSILCLLYQLFPLTWFRRIIKVMFVIVFLWLVGLLLAVWLLCRPLAKEWEPELPGSCGNEQELILAYAISPMCLDIILMVLPLPVLWGLQIPTRKKVVLSIIFGLSFGAVATNAVRTGITINYAHEDVTVANQLQGIMQALELSLGIMIASAPTLQPVIERFRSTISSSRQSGNSYNKQATYYDLDKRRKNSEISREEILLRDRTGLATPGSGHHKDRVLDIHEVHSEISDQTRTSSQMV